ncbi:MAG: hypothetical protein AAGK98_05910 [Pseudomonadota bacterium]
MLKTLSILTLAPLALLASVGSVAAQDGLFEDITVGVAVGAGTMGAVIEPQVRFNEYFGIRAPIGFGQYDFEFSDSELTYDSSLTLGGAGVLADFFPLQGGLRLSGGVIATNEEIDVTARADDIVLDGITYGTVEIDGKVSPDQPIQPVVALGYSSNTSIISLDVDVGLRFSGSWTATLDNASTGVGVDQVSDETLRNEERAIEDEFNRYQVTPFIKIGGRLRF